jgi:hypothetical protein
VREVVCKAFKLLTELEDDGSLEKGPSVTVVNMLETTLDENLADGEAVALDVESICMELDETVVLLDSLLETRSDVNCDAVPLDPRVDVAVDESNTLDAATGE